MKRMGDDKESIDGPTHCRRSFTALVSITNDVLSTRQFDYGVRCAETRRFAFIRAWLSLEGVVKFWTYVVPSRLDVKLHRRTRLL